MQTAAVCLGPRTQTCDMLAYSIFCGDCYWRNFPEAVELMTAKLYHSLRESAMFPLMTPNKTNVFYPISTAPALHHHHFLFLLPSLSSTHTHPLNHTVSSLACCPSLPFKHGILQFPALAPPEAKVSLSPFFLHFIVSIS